MELLRPNLRNRSSNNENIIPTAKPEKNPITNDAETFLKIIAKNFMSIHLMARDLNVARQNSVKLVKLEGGEAVNKADAWFLKEGEREKKLEVEAGKGKEKTPEPKQPYIRPGPNHPWRTFCFLDRGKFI
mgnify:CR=1 FL=1